MRCLQGTISETSEYEERLDLVAMHARERTMLGLAGVLASLTDNPGLASANRQAINNLPGSDVGWIRRWRFRVDEHWCNAEFDPRLLPPGRKQVIVIDGAEGSTAVAAFDPPAGQVMIHERWCAGFAAQALAHLLISACFGGFAFLVMTGMLLLGLSGRHEPFPWSLLVMFGAIMPAVCVLLWVLITYREWPSWKQATAIFRCMGLPRPAFVNLDRSTHDYYAARGIRRPGVMNLYRLPESPADAGPDGADAR